jgi:hypothetical protein
MADPLKVPMTDLITKPDSETDSETIDADLLLEAQNHLGGASPNATLNEALRLLVETKRATRREALERLRKRSDEGLFNYDALDVVDQ